MGIAWVSGQKLLGTVLKKKKKHKKVSFAYTKPFAVILFLCVCVCFGGTELLVSISLKSLLHFIPPSSCMGKGMGQLSPCNILQATFLLPEESFLEEGTFPAMVFVRDLLF